MLDQELERRVTAVLQARADEASQRFDPHHVAEAAIRGAAARASRRRWRWATAIAAAVAVTLVVGALSRNAVADAPQPTSTPSPSATPAPSPSGAVRGAPSGTGSFLRTFAYVLPPGRPIELFEYPNIMGFVEADIEAPDLSSEIYAATGAMGAVQPGAHGVVVAVVDEPVTHACPPGPERSVPMRPAPAQFLDDLRDIAAIPVGPVTSTTIDGRPVLTTAISGRGQLCGSDFHVKAYTGLPSSWVRLDLPSRLFVLQVDGLTVVVQIWATTEPDLASWADEVADQFVQSMDFEAP